MRSPLLLIAACATLAAPALLGDAGILIPSNAQEPDPAVLSLDEMTIHVLIDNGNAKVSVREIFASHVANVLEGNYVFALPGGAAVSDFAVWDDVTRIPGVILERKRAGEVYQDIRNQAIDPGLLQMGERGEEEATRGAVFSARIVPIPPYGDKRIEIEYQQRIPIERLQGYFAIPLRPDAYRAQAAGRLSIDFELRSQHPLQGFDVTSKAYPLTIRQRTPHLVKADFEGSNVALSEDFAAQYTLESPKKDALEVIGYREPGDSGYFEADALVRMPNQQTAAAPRTVVALFDASLSMQWVKLERSFEALEKLLHSLTPQDHFNVVLFNSEVAPFQPSPVAASPENVEKALAFVRSSRLRGDTNLQGALQAALAQSASNSYIVLLGDCEPTHGIIQNGKLAQWYSTEWREKPAADRPRTYIFAVGDDANMPLVKLLAQNDGVAEWVRSTEPIDFKLNAFLAKIGRQPLEGLQLTENPSANFSLVYPLTDSTFPGSMASWVGEYQKPGRATFVVKGIRDGKSMEARAKVNLPAGNTEHTQLPRTWARARVDALLEKIEREGEDQKTIDEIIRLSRKYKFITPYTSFLAAPRALLRPRLIRPGDPVLRVKTDPSIVSVTALFPFGLMKKLRYLKDEDTWETRFLVPTDMNDGAYGVRLVLRDREGRAYRESKTFVIASKPPAIRVELDKSRYRPGDTVHLKVRASKTARTIVARLYGAMPAYIRWNPGMRVNSGRLVVPAYLAAGRYKLTVTAEDFAHNIGTEEVSIEVAP
jgi:Ca-activated chloride channel homolog